MPEPQVSTGTRTFRQIIAADEYRSWINLLWDKAGRVIILSDYGNWSYMWPCRGEGVTTEAFLLQSDSEYVGKKMMGSEYWEFDLEKTVERILEQIKDEETECDETLREEQNLLDLLSCGDMDFDTWCRKTTIEDAYELARHSPCNDWTQLWERLWIPFVKPELEKMASLTAPSVGE
jgi:hypothetical protein